MSKYLKTESYEQAGASTFKFALKIFGYSVLAGIMSLFVYFSINMIAQGAFTQTIGYTQVEVVNDETGETRVLDTVIFEEGETVSTTIATDDRRISNNPIVVPKNDVCLMLLKAADILEQALMLIILIAMTGYYIYREGDRDRNLVKHHQRAETPMRGLVIGLIAAIPSAVILLLPMLGKCGVMSESVLGVYRTLNPCVLPMINGVIPVTTASATQLSVWQLLCLVAFWAILPVTGAVSYTLGYRRLFTRKKKKTA